MTLRSTQGVTELARETVMGLGQLVGQHVKIARLELKAELQVMGRRARLLGVLTALMAVGYALAMAGLAVLIAGQAALGLPLVVIGLVHVAGGGVGLVLAQRRGRGVPLLSSSSAALSTSLATFKAAPDPQVAAIVPFEEKADVG